MTRENFNSLKHLISVYKKVYNPLVNEYFDDVDADDAIEISTPRASLKAACKVLETDNLPLLQARLWLFYVVLKNLSVNSIPVYGIPVARFHSESVEFKPQVLLYFQSKNPQNEQEWERGILSAEISFRLMWEENAIANSKIRTLATQIKNAFATPKYTWTKGAEIVTYRSLSEGFELRLYAQNKAEGVRVARDIVGLTDYPFRQECIGYTQSDRNFPVNPGTETVLGKTQRKIRRRPIGLVEFRYAQFSWHKLHKPIILVDTEFKFPEPILRVA